MLLNLIFFLVSLATKPKTGSKSKEEQIKEKRQELEKKLQDVTGQLGQQITNVNKKLGNTSKKGKLNLNVKILCSI